MPQGPVTPESYAEFLRSLAPFFVEASVGEFSTPLVIPEEDTPFSPILVGVEVMRQVIREQLDEVESLNRELRAMNTDLERKVDERTLAVLQGEERLRRLSVARPVVRSLIRGLIDAGPVPPSKLLAFGEDLASRVDTDDMGAFVNAFDAMGLGQISFTEPSPGRYLFDAHDLIERREGPRMTTCFLTSGFLSGATRRVLGRPAVSGEIACQSRGDASCQFVARGQDSGSGRP